MTMHAFHLARDGRTARATEAAAGPWSPLACHGGAPAALAVRVAEAVPTLAPLDVARLTLDLFRPVPVAELEIATNILREGKKLQLVAVSLSHAGTEVCRATVLKLRRQGIDAPADALPPSMVLTSPEASTPTPGGLMSGGFPNLFELRAARGGFQSPGPAAVWFRLKGQIIAGEVASPAVRAAAVADFGNGVSGVLPFDRWTYLNADLTLNLHRAPQGEWLLLDAETWVGDDGRALAHSRLGDERGWCGTGSQNLLVDPR